MKCALKCFERNHSFNKILNKETRFNISLEELSHSNISWFIDKSIVDNTIHIREWALPKTSSLYFLWLKEDYCDVHQIFLMKCLYIGKGRLSERIINHFKSKDFSEEMLVYFTYLEIENRKSKYIEQLLLDIYKIPFNKRENKGDLELYEYFTQSEVD